MENTTKILNTTTSYLVGRIPFVELDTILFGIFTFLFMVFGIFANLLTMLVIAKSKNLRSIFHFFIFSLCVSDITSALVSWVNWYRRTLGFDYFALPDFICVMYRVGDIWTSYSTALHILSFAILRLISLKWPFKMNRMKKGYPVGLIWVISLWVITFFCGAVPFILMHGARVKNRASGTPDSKWPACTVLPEWFHQYVAYTKIAFPIFFYVPIIFTLCLSCCIVIFMFQRRTVVVNHMSSNAADKRNKKEKNAVLQLILIVTSFMIGYIPFTAFEFKTSSTKNDSYDTWWFDWHFGSAQYMFLRFSECLNPIFYNVGSKTMWNETKKFLNSNCGFLLCKKPKIEPTSATGSTVFVNFVKS